LIRRDMSGPRRNLAWCSRPAPPLGTRAQQRAGRPDRPTDGNL